MHISKLMLRTIVLLAVAGSAFAQDAGVSVRLEAEAGAIKVFHHSYRSGTAADGNTNFDFVTMGGQEILYPFQRISAELGIGERHRVRLLYQPLELATQTVAREAFTVDEVTFAEGTPVDIVYSFPFYRATYLYDLLPGPAYLGVGGALQLRNASIRFTGYEDPAGTIPVRAVSQNLGPVPALAVYGEFPFGERLYAGFELTGLYASSAFINGADFEFEGSILDASARVGLELRPGLSTFVNLRFLGGSAAGVSQYPDRFWTESQSSATSNYLATGSVTLGARVDL